MRPLLWPGLFLLSSSWFFFIPQFSLPDPFIGACFLCLGTLCLIVSLWKTTFKHIDTRYYLLFIPLGLSLVVVPYPYNLGILVLLVGFLLFTGFSFFKKAHAIPLGILLAGLILCLQTVVFPLYTIVVSHGHRIERLTSVISWTANVLGLHTTTNNGLLVVSTPHQVYSVAITWETLGFSLWVSMLFGALLLFFFFTTRQKSLKNLGILLIASIGYLLLRTLALLEVFVATERLDVFWDPYVLTLSFLPFALLLMKLIPLGFPDRKTIHMPALAFTKKHLVAMILLFLLVFSSIGTLAYNDPGKVKNGRVLIDEVHSDWEDTIRPLDTDWYGLLSTYNYYSWAEWIGHYYTMTRNTNHTLTTEFLRQYDIVILKCPTESYSTDEVQALVTYVKNGGGLFLIGDHTNVFGMNTFLNQVSEQFGIRFRNDATYELGTGDLSVYHPPAFCAHPVVSHITQFDFMTSCTLEPTSPVSSITLENIMIGNRVSSEPGTYATENFFRESVDSSDAEYGFILQAAAVKYGHGRVVAFTDSTVFSSFSVFTDGYTPFTLGVLTYLNKINSLAYLNFVFLSISIASAILFLILIKNTKKIKVLWMVLFVGLLACSIAAPLFTYLTTVAYPLPTPRQNATLISFEHEHSQVNISVKPTAFLTETANNYGTFFVWTQRVGCVPRLAATLDEAVEKGDIIVIINPVVSFSDSDLARITQYLQSGGNILLMDSITNEHSTANTLLSEFGLWITTNTTDTVLYHDTNQTTSNTSIGQLSSPYLTITGGRPLLSNENNEHYAAMVTVTSGTTHQNGILMALVDSASFSDAVMGGPFVEPNQRQQEIFNTEFFIINALLSQK